MTVFTIDTLATTLNVTRRTVERALKAGHIKPTGYVPGTAFRERGHFTFDHDYVEGLKCRVSDARSHGFKYVMASITPTGMRERKAAPSAEVRARRTLWKLKNGSRRSSPEATLALALAQLLD